MVFSSMPIPTREQRTINEQRPNDAHTESYANNDNPSLSVFIYKSVGRLG